MRHIARQIRRIALGLSLSLVLVTALHAEPRVIELRIDGGVLPADRRVIRVAQGDELTLRWTTDAPVTLHLHGYDVERRVLPGTPTTMTFRARATGRFPITIHGPQKGGEATLGYLEVHPP